MAETTKSTTAWLIEYEGQFLTMYGGDDDAEHRVLGVLGWSTVPCAIRFSRRVDGVRMLGVIRDLYAKLPYREGLPGLRLNDSKFARVTEHVWINGPDLTEDRTNG